MSRLGSGDASVPGSGMCPANKENAGKRKTGRSRKGNRYVRSILCDVPNAARRTHSQPDRPSWIFNLITAATVVVILFVSCPASLTLLALAIDGHRRARNGSQRRDGALCVGQRSGWSEVNRVFDETVQGMDTLKLQAAGGRRCAQFQERTAVLQEASEKASVLLSVFSPGIELFSKIGGLALLALACYLVSNGAIVLEAFLLFFFYTTLLQMSVAQLIQLLATAQNEFVALKHLSAFFSESIEMEEASSAAVVPECSSEIELRGVTFGYPGGRKLYREPT